LIFASFAHLRFIQTLTGRGDELMLAQQWFASPLVVLLAAAVFLIGLPPVIAAFSAIGNRRRALVFAGSWLAPLPLLFVILVASRALYGDNGDQVSGATLLGVPILVLVTQAAAAMLFVALAGVIRKSRLTRDAHRSTYL
jgi:hypothetical protein